MENNTLQHPTDKYHSGEFPMQRQNAPGLQSRMNPVPDCGERSYRGHGRLEGRKALVTGGDSGIGRAVAIAFAREGAKVAINYLEQEQSDADSLAELLRKEGTELVQLPGDLREVATSRRIVREACERLDGLDILVLNAGVQTAAEDIADITEEQVQRTFAVNVFAPLFMAQAAVPLLPSGSSIIITASAEYYTPNKLLLDYAASKSAVTAFGVALSKYLLDKGVRVNSVCPGPTWTPLEVSGGNPDQDIPRHGVDTPLERAAQPAEMAGIYVFLASEEASYITGEIYGITGGLSGK